MDHRRSFVEKLQETHEFPGVYTFKIIGEIHTLQKECIDGAVRNVVPNAMCTLTQRTSAGGRFVAWSMELYVQNADTVVDIYEQLMKLPGLRSLF